MRALNFVWFDDSSGEEHTGWSCRVCLRMFAVDLAGQLISSDLFTLDN